jgi:Flp pilus assembly protein TadB
MRPISDSFRKESGKHSSDRFIFYVVVVVAVATVVVVIAVVVIIIVLVVVVAVYHYFIAKHISNDKLHYTFSPKNA